jgi:hypothetical protein
MAASMRQHEGKDRSNKLPISSVAFVPPHTLCSLHFVVVPFTRLTWEALGGFQGNALQRELVA